MAEFMPMSEQFCRLIRADDRFLVSYPRSGSRWLRLALTDLVNQHHGRNPIAVYERQMEIEQRREFTSPSQIITPGRFMPDATMAGRAKAQWPQLAMQPVFRSHNVSQLTQHANVRVVYMFREPAAAFRSHFYFLREVNHEAVADGDVSAFCWRMIASWTNHVTSALTLHRESPERIVLLRYGKPQPVSSQQLRMVATFLEIEYTASMIEGAISRLGGFLKSLNQQPGLKYRRGGSKDVFRSTSLRVWAKIKWRTRKSYQQATRTSRKQLCEFTDVRVPNKRAA